MDLQMYHPLQASASPDSRWGSPSHEERSQWDAVPDLDKFLSNFYKYYEEKGFASIVASRVMHLVVLLFTIVFSFFLLVFVEWRGILGCDSEEVCRDLNILRFTPLSKLGPIQIVGCVYFVVFLLLWLLNIVWALYDIREAHSASLYYKNRLKIGSDEALISMDWSEIVSLLIRQQEKSPFCIVKERLTPLEITNIILREDNFLVAFTKCQLLTSSLPRCIPKRIAYTKSLLWNVRYCVFHRMFDNRSRIDPEFVHSPDKLARRFRWMAVINFVLMGPTLIFVTMFFFLRHAEDFRTNKSKPFHREFNSFAEWTFREINELPHHLMERLRKALPLAEEYVNSGWHSPVRDNIRRCIKYIAGSFLAILVAIAVWDETPLLFVKVGDKNLLWYLAVFGFLVAVTHSSRDEACGAGDSSPSALYETTMRLAQYTHYLPTPFTGNLASHFVVVPSECGGAGRRHSHSGAFKDTADVSQYRQADGDATAEPLAAVSVEDHEGVVAAARAHQAVRDSFENNFYTYHVWFLLEEIVGVVLTPIVLGVWLPLVAGDICRFVRSYSFESGPLGDWCSFQGLDDREASSQCSVWYSREAGACGVDGSCTTPIVAPRLCASSVHFPLSGGGAGGRQTVPSECPV